MVLRLKARESRLLPSLEDRSFFIICITADEAVNHLQLLDHMFEI